jgi:hypothetical protein
MPDPHGKTPVVFDATIPDHFAIAAAMEPLAKRYADAMAFMPNLVRDELVRAAGRLPSLQDALNAPWLKDYEVTVGDLPIIEQMREDAFGEEDPLRGLGECVAIHMAEQLGYRLGIEDRVARRMAQTRDIKTFNALQVVQALYRFCSLTKGDCWQLYERLRNGTGRRGTKLTSLDIMGRTKLEKHVSNKDATYA